MSGDGIDYIDIRALIKCWLWRALDPVLRMAKWSVTKSM